MAKQTVIPKQVYSGRVVGGQINVPGNVTGTVTCLLDLDPTEKLDPAKEVWIKLEKLVGSTWEFSGGCQYIGGTYFMRDGITPQVDFGFTADAPEYRGDKVQVVIEVPPPKTMIVGAFIDWVK